MLDSKNIDKPWKIFIWVIGIYSLLKFPLRFFKTYFSEAIDVLFMIVFFIFLISVLIVGYLYSWSTKKILEKKLRFRTALYTSIFTLVGGLFVAFITQISFLEVIINSVATFLIVYYLIIIGCKFYKK